MTEGSSKPGKRMAPRVGCCSHPRWREYESLGVKKSMAYSKMFWSEQVTDDEHLSRLVSVTNIRMKCGDLNQYQLYSVFVSEPNKQLLGHLAEILGQYPVSCP